MKKVLIIVLCIMVLFSGCRYQRISYDADTLEEELSSHIDEGTEIENSVQVVFEDTMPIYTITERTISEEDCSQMLEALELPDDEKYIELDNNSLYYSLVDYTDSSRGYFEMTDDEVEKIAWEYFEKIPFIEGEYECLGIRDTYTRNDSSGDHILRAGVTFCRLLGGVRVVGEENCTLFFDGSGLVAINMKLFEYEKNGTMNMVPLDEAAERITTPDSFSVETLGAGPSIGIAERLQVEKIALRLVNQYKRGCTILQPVYCFFGKATDEDNIEAEFTSLVIAIPKSYTYEADK